MQGVVRFFAIVVGACVGASALGACESHTVAPPADAGPSGLTVPWSVSPTVPGNATTTIAITDLIFRVESLRVVGDAGTSVSADDVELEWTTGTTPMPTLFAGAPTGLYSKVVFHADGDQSDYSWEIDGLVQLPDGMHPYAIHDREDLDVDIDTSAMLEPGGNATLGVLIDIAQPFAGLDFTKLDTDGGTLTLDTDDSQMDDFRDKLRDAIVAQPGPAPQ